MSKIWVFIDQFKGTVLPASWEALGVGKTLGDVTAIVFGEGVENIAQEAFHYGADEVLLADDPILTDFRAEPYARLISGLAEEPIPDVILFPTTSRGRDLAAMTAIDLATGVLVDVTAIEVVDGNILATRPVYGGKLLSKVKCNTRPQILTLRSRAFPQPEADKSLSGSPTKVEVNISETEISTKVTGYAEDQGGVSLMDAAVIVSGGRGVSNNPKLEPPANLDQGEGEKWRAQEGFKLVGELAAVVGGAVGASRAAVDAGYIPYVHQVGQTGKVVSPDLYIACGISGAIQHLAGMRSSKVIVAINKDPDAPIFKLARFGVVGDLYEILPPLTETLQARLGK
ncbi:electron transfer flavoprotein subunit alpha/FixB family protein [Chloroflexota bacterium]